MNENKEMNFSDRIKFGIIERIKNPIIQKRIVDSIDDYKSKFLAILKSEDIVKLEALDKNKWDELDEKRIIENLKEDSLKIKALDKFKEHINIKMSGYEPEIIEEKFSMYEASIISTIKDDNAKMLFVDRISEKNDLYGKRLEIALSISDEKIRYDCMQKLSEDEKLIVISASTDNFKEKLIEELKQDNEKIYIIKSFNDDKLKLKYIDKVNNTADQVDIVISMNDDDIKFQTFEKVNPETITILRIAGTFNFEMVSDNISLFVGKELGINVNDIQVKKIIETIEEMGTRNNEVLKTIRFGLLDEKYLESLGKDKIDIIACYPKAQEKLLSLNESQYNIFKITLDSYIKNEEQAEWQTFADRLLSSISSGTYDKLIDNILEQNDNEIPIDILNILSNEINYFNVTSIEDIKNIDLTKQRVYDLIENNSENNEEELKKYPQIYKMNNLDRKKFIVLQKVYGQDALDVNSILEKFGEDIDKIKFEDKDIDLKYYIESLKNISKIDDEKVLDMLISDNSIGSLKINSISIERTLKSIYAREFNKGLVKAKVLQDIEQNGLEGYNVKVAGTELEMIITSVAPFYENSPENYCSDWNRETLSSQGFCCSYIRNDMLGTAEIPHFCYGFEEMEDDSLMLSGAKDINSKTNKLKPTSWDEAEKYYSPDNQINNTSKVCSYNEMVYKRTQNGERKQPSYIVLFKSDEKINNGQLKKAKKAVDDYKKEGIDLPIVIINKDEIAESEKNKIDSKVEEYITTRDVKQLEQIKQKISNNKKGNSIGDYEDKIKNIEITYPAINIENTQVKDKIDISEYRENYVNGITIKDKQSSELERTSTTLNKKITDEEYMV